ncbi:MAG: LLM class flavin-dependent oxidoreductase, partial [Actinobacteria bacterium]|nr:LLM class flavin-dependent oxidoreductase [Actinomycetota bacterium]
DGWVPSSSYVAPEELAERHERIDAGAAAAGRRPDEIRRIYNVFGTITDGESRGRLDGPVRQWVDELTSYALEYGMDTFVFGAAEDDARQIRRFAAEVVPAVREQVAAHRPAVV